MAERGLMARRSIASCGPGGKFYWRYCAAQDHIEAAVDYLMDAVTRDHPARRSTNPYWARLTRSAFRRRLEAAQRGELEPVDEVKPIGDHIPESNLFEIRWSEIPVREQNPQAPDDAAKDLQAKVEVRLYFAEPPNCGLAILGLHCHEKRVHGTDAQIREAQDEEIAHAFKMYADGFKDRWGVDFV